MSTRLDSVFKPLDQAADAVIRESGRAQHHAPAGERLRLKVRVLASLADGIGYVGNATSVVQSDLADAGYGPEFCDPVWAARKAISAAAEACGEAETALRRLLDTSGTSA
jgi:hypothetical protein